MISRLHTDQSTPSVSSLSGSGSESSSSRQKQPSHHSDTSAETTVYGEQARKEREERERQERERQDRDRRERERRERLDRPLIQREPPAMDENRLQQMIADSINAAVDRIRNEANQHRQREGPSGPQGERGEQGPPGPTSTRTNLVETLGYFDPGYAADNNESIVSAGRYTYYRDVFVWIDHLKEIAKTESDDTVRAQISSCLRGEALVWHSAELSELERDLLREASIERWIKALTSRFKERGTDAMEALDKLDYSTADARSGKTPRAFVHDVIRHARAAELPLYNQLLLAYTKMNAKFRIHLDEPTTSTSMSAFMSMIDAKTNAFLDIAKDERRSSSVPASNRGQYSNFAPRGRGYRPYQDRFYSQPNYGGYGGYGSGYNDFQRFPYQSNASGYQNNYQSNSNRPPQSSQQYTPRPQQQIAGPRQPLAITAPPNAFGSSFQNNRLPNRPNRGGSRGNRFMRGTYRPKVSAYQTSTEDQENVPESTEQTPDSTVSNDPENNDWHPDDAYYQHAYDDSYIGQDDFNNDIYYGNNGNSGSPEEQGQHEAFAGFVGFSSECDNCHMSFPSRTKLHKHLRTDCSSRQKQMSPLSTAASNGPLGVPLLPKQDDVLSEHDDNDLVVQANMVSADTLIVPSTASNEGMGAGLGFRSWNYAQAAVRLAPHLENVLVCLDSGCGASLIDRAWLLEQLPDVPICKMATSLRVKGIGSASHDTDEYITITFYLPGTKDNQKVLFSMTRELHLVNDLRAKMLIGNDIIGPEGIVLDIGQGHATIGNGVQIDIVARQRKERFRTPVQAKDHSIVSPHSSRVLPIRAITVPEDRDFVFEPAQHKALSLYAHLVDHSFKGVLVKNESDFPVRLKRKHVLGAINDIDEENCFQMNTVDLACCPPQKPPRTKSWIKKLTAGVMAAAALLSTACPSTSTAPNQPCEQRLNNGIMVYGDQPTRATFESLVNQFPTVWQDTGFVDIPEDKWMKLSLKSDWESRIKNKTKVYPLGLRDREVVDKTFDQLHDQGRLSFTEQPTPFSYPVFVVWKNTPDGQRKGRAVVDIRGLNELLVPDTYPVPLQSEVISRLIGCKYLSVMDAVSFFYQWRAHPSTKHLLTVVTHRGQETFNVPIMGCLNSVAYVQRRIDEVLRPIKEFAKAYIDDIVAGSKELSEHVTNLRKLFTLLREHNISLSPTKTFLGYPSVSLLGQKVDSLGLSTSEEKLAAIRLLKYPITLGDLEHYLGFTGYLRDRVHFYAQRAQPLQKLKTALLKDSPSGNKRKAYSSVTRLPTPPSPSEEESFRSLQDALSQPCILVHFDSGRVLWIDLDASKAFGFGAVIFHVKAGYTVPEGKWPARTAIEPIMFLSKMLSTAETHYWPTELEIAGFVWVIKKVRHLVDSSKQPTVIQTDHSAILDMMKQTNIVTTSSTVRNNNRYVRSSQFLQQFRLDVRHKPGKEHILPDALSRLASLNNNNTDDHRYELDGLCTNALFSATMVEISQPFLKKVLDGYQEDEFWKKVDTQLKQNDNLPTEDAAKLPFVRGNKLHLLATPADLLNNKKVHNNSVDLTRPKMKMVLIPKKDVVKVSPNTEMVRRELPMLSEQRSPVPLSQSLVPVRSPQQGLVPLSKQTAALIPTQARLPEHRQTEDRPMIERLGIVDKQKDQLIYHVDKFSGLQRLCIPTSAIKDIFDTAHGAMHPGYQRCFEIISMSWYIHRLSHYLKSYIRHCPTCLTYQTRRHKPYGSLQPIYAVPHPFHTLTIDFVMALPTSVEGFDIALSVTDKFTKRVTVIAGRSTFQASNWADVLIERLEIADWGLPKVILSDRDRKFLSELWTALFKRLGVDLLYSTAYHPQTDGMSERTNQTVEIALRFMIHTMDDPTKWPQTLSTIQSILNNSTSSATTQAPNEVSYGFVPMRALDLVNTTLPSRAHLMSRTTAADAITFAQTMNKHHYDRAHTPMYLRENDYALLRLHKGYTIPSGKGNPKYGQQYVGPFKVLQRIGRLAYKLDIPKQWKIHPVFTIAQLEPCPAPDADPFDRPRPTHPPPVFADKENQDLDEYEIDRLLDKRIIRKGRGLSVQYLARWVGYGPEDDMWRTLPQLEHCQDLIDDYERSHATIITTPSI